MIAKSSTYVIARVKNRDDLIGAREDYRYKRQKNTISYSCRSHFTSFAFCQDYIRASAIRTDGLLIEQLRVIIKLLSQDARIVILSPRNIAMTCNIAITRSSKSGTVKFLSILIDNVYYSTILRIKVF